MYISSLSVASLFLLVANSSFIPSADAFSVVNSPKQVIQPLSPILSKAQAGSRLTCLYQSSSTESSEVSEASPAEKKKTKKLTLLTFDLDDTLYPIETIINEANVAFARIMGTFGYENIEPSQIVSTGRDIRERMALTDPKDAACLSHTEIRRLAIREEMEKIVYQRKLEACAEDWATQVSSLSPLVVQNAKT